MPCPCFFFATTGMAPGRSRGGGARPGLFACLEKIRLGGLASDRGSCYNTGPALLSMGQGARLKAGRERVISAVGFEED